jgi:type IV pilus assembly protein PilB
MIGEIRDEETASLAVNAAETGHLVLSTLHTNDAPSTIFRLRNLGLKPYQLASSLGAIIAQRLVRTLCEECKQPISAEAIQAISPLWPEHLRQELSESMMSVGCSSCHDTGYRGRTALSSLLVVTDSIADAISEEVTPVALARIAKSEGFSTLEDEALWLMRNGKTAAHEIIAYIEKPDSRSNASKSKTKTATNSSPSAVSESSLRKAKILLVEDDEDLRSILAMLLSREMYEVTEAADGDAALQAVFQNAPDLIICDYMMPKMNGREFLTKLKSHPGSGLIPVVMLTAIDGADNECNFLELGARDFISKGSPSEVMLSRIRRVLQDRK